MPRATYAKMAPRSRRTLICCNAAWLAPTAGMASTMGPPKKIPHDHDRDPTAMPMAATATRPIDTIASVFNFGSETLGSPESLVPPAVVITGTLAECRPPQHSNRTTAHRGMTVSPIGGTTNGDQWPPWPSDLRSSQADPS